MTLSGNIAGRLKLRNGDVVTVGCGQSAADEVKVVVSERVRSETALISRELHRLLNLSLPLGLHVRRTEDGTVRLGPIVGILARATRGAGGRFSSQTAYFAALVRTGRRIAVPTFVITPEGIDWDQKSVRAWSLGSGGWMRVTIPLPDVVYDRVQSRRLDLLPRTREAKERLQAHPEIKVFNTGFLDKWDTHQSLDSEETQRFLPETKLLSTRQDILDFARRYRTVYVKPAGGSLGQGIYVIQRRRRRYRVIHYGSKRVRHIRNLRSPSIVWRRLQRLRKKRRYVVQQGIQFARYRGRRFDLRLLAQKTGDNAWEISAIYARVAPPGSLRANLDAGGKAVRGSRVLRHIFGRGGNRVMRRVLKTGIDVAEAIERTSEGTIGELGIDIGVDRLGRAWVIEANSKPLRQMEGPRKRLARTLRRPLQYASRLAGF